MHIAVIGAGNIGANFARHVAAAGHEVRISGSGNTEKLNKTARDVGAIPATTPEALADAEIVLLAMPWVARAAVFADAGALLAGRIVIDAMNPYTTYPAVEDLHGLPSSEVVAQALPGARIVKVLNTLFAARLADGARPKGAADRIALPIAGDDQPAKEAIMALLDQIGFDTVDTGSIAQSLRQEPDQALYAHADTRTQLLERMA